MSQDLRQDLAQYYDKEVGKSPRGLLPELWATDLSSTQETARNLVIEKWAGERSAGIERDIAAALDNPALEGLKIPAVASEASVAGRYSGGSGLPSAHAVSVGKQSTTRADAIISTGVADLRSQKDRRNSDARFALGQGPTGPKP